jgi:hypothetical protein
MSADNARINEQAVLLGVVPPVTGVQSGVNSQWVDMTVQRQLLCIVNGGAATSGSLDVKLQQATDSSGTSAKDISGKAITQITTNDQTATIEVSAWELDRANGFTHVSADVTTTNAADAVGVVLVGGVKGRYLPSTTISDEDIEQTIS